VAMLKRRDVQIMGRSIPDNVLRGELPRLARESGCVVCRAARAAVDRFFAWYRIEQYHEPSIIQRMQEARGFCPEHTRQFVAISSPTHLVSAVYRDLLASAINVVRSAARESSALPGALADRIRPQAACLACEHQEAAVSWIARGLSVGFTDSQMRAAILRPSALCLPHFVRLLPPLDWEAAQLLAHAQLASLMAALAKYDTGAEPTELVRLLVGAASDQAFLMPPSQTPMIDPADTPAMDAIRVQDAQGTMGNNNTPTEQASWSPAVANIEARLSAPGCPLCREEVATVATYLSWLSQELSERTPSQAGDDVYWLCRSHLWHFIGVGDDKTVGALLRSVSAYWMGIVQTLISGLDQQPSTCFVMRCWDGMLNARQRTPGVTAWHALWEGIAEGRRSMTKRLAELRDPVMRMHLCPACRFQREHADRLADLLDRALGDAGLARRYEDAFGICFHHLPLAISRCTNPAT
jgi:hypothetical protein